jgi:hypothetical protein
MAKITITYTPAEYPIVYKDGFDGITIPAIFIGQNAYVDGEDYDKSSYDTNNYGLGIDWDVTYEYFKSLTAHPGLIAAMKAAYEAGIDASKDAGAATAGSVDYDVTGLTGPVIEYFKSIINGTKGYTAEDKSE